MSEKSVAQKIQDLLMKDMLKRAEEGELSAQEWAVMAKFLKDNNVTIAQEDSNELDKLREQLEKKRRRGLSPEEKDDIVVPFGKRG